jgi:hypothetical protein
MGEKKRRSALHMSRDQFRAKVAEQDERWREQGHAEDGGDRNGWGLPERDPNRDR